MPPDDVFINERVTIPWGQLSVSFAKSGGPGGQHVNKVNSKVYLRWNLSKNNELNEGQRRKIEQELAGYLTDEGEILIYSTRSRSQQQNLEDCIEKLRTLVAKALKPKKIRKKMKMPRAIKEKRLQNKKKNAQKKKMRTKVDLG